MCAEKGDLADGRITEEALAVYRSRVGMSLRVSGIFNEFATRDAIRRYCDGIGEGNPLYRDPDYAAASPFGRLVAPPSWVMSVFPGWILQGLPGVHVLHTSSDFEFLAPVAEGTRIVPESVFTGFRQVKSALGERAIIEIQNAAYKDGDGRVLTRVKVTGLRAEREAAREAGACEDFELPHPWTPGELLALEERVLAEACRGAEPRYFEDVQVGDVLPPVTKGPLGLTDIIAYCVGAAPVKTLAHGLALREFRRHPAWAFRDRDTCALEPIFGVHYNKNAAASIGMPYPYDVGSQRHAWLIQMLTNWMGDAGWLKRCYAKYSGFVFLSDAVTITGHVTKTYVNSGGECCVDIATSAVNQRGQEVMPGNSTVILPSRAGGAFPASLRLERLAAPADDAEVQC